MDHFGVPGKGGRPYLRGLIAHPVQHILRRIHHTAAGGIRNRLQHNEIPETLQQVHGEAARVVPGVDHRLHRAEQGGGIPRGERVDGLVDQGDVGGAQQGQRPLVVHPVVLGPGKQLVEHAEGVARRSAAGADNERVHRVVDLDVLRFQDLLDQPPHRFRRQQPERIVMGTRADRRQHLLRLGGGEHEDHMFRWFLDDLQQRVEAGGGDHVRFVDDEDAVTRLCRRERRPIAQFPGVIHTAMAGRVEFDHVERPAAIGREGDARIAHPTRSRCRPLFAVERPGQDSGRRRLTAAARPRKEVRVVDTARGQSRRQRLCDVFLTHHLGEGRRPVLAVEGHGSRLPTFCDVWAYEQRFRRRQERAGGQAVDRVGQI